MLPQPKHDLDDVFEIRLQASDLAARHALKTVMRYLTRHGLSRQIAGDVQLVLAEALNNVIEHAYAGTGQGPICLHGRITAHHLDLRITDTGRPLPGGTLPPATFPDLSGPAHALPEGGFGWCLIHELSGSVRYCRDGGKNILLLGFDTGPDR